MPFNVLETITEEERLNFSQSFDVKRPGILGTIFPVSESRVLQTYGWTATARGSFCSRT
mgnify:CR=1 FL=1